jgi:hypothetical protein
MCIPHVPVYHITHIDNLQSIVRDGFLWCDQEQRRRGASHQNIGYSHIKERRLRHPVKVAKGGTLGQYVPFYFGPRSVMLYVISKGHEKYNGGQESVVHLVSSVAIIAQQKSDYFFTDRHADLGYAEQFQDLTSLPSKVNLSIMHEKHWASSQEVKEKRQAEFLVHDSCPWSVIEEVGVHNPDMVLRVQAILQEASHQPQVNVRRNWYYEGGRHVSAGPR